MTKAKGRTRISRGLVDMAETQESEEFLARFEPEDLLEDRYDFDLGDKVRCIVKMLVYQKRVAWFSIVVQVIDGGEWKTYARADTCHSQAHVHWFSRRQAAELDRQTLVNLNTIEDVEHGYDLASDLLIEAWEESLRQWGR